MNFYNDNEPSSVAWLKALMEAGLIGKGVIDGRSITELRAEDVVGFHHVCLFAGIAGWERALQLAGWPDDRPVWTGSCPCPPFSQAGRKSCKQCGGRLGFYGADDFGCERCGIRDERHLWPEMRRLIALGRPATVFGEQVASADGRQWLSRVRADLEALDYAVGCADLCAAGASAPQIRQRLYWVANGSKFRREQKPAAEQSSNRQDLGVSIKNGRTDNLADDGRLCVPGRREVGDMAGAAGVAEGVEAERQRLRDAPGDGGIAERKRRRVVFAFDESSREDIEVLRQRGALVPDFDRLGMPLSPRPQERPGPENDDGAVRQQGPAAPAAGPWDDFEVLVCDDGKGDVCFRRTLTGVRPLAARLSGRVALLKGLGNSIVPPLAAQFIEAFLEAETMI